MNDRRIVFSTDSGRVVERGAAARRPSRPVAKQAPSLPNDGVVRIFRERGKRGGKTVTLVRGLPSAELEARAVELKRLCGAGGTVRDEAIEIQGDHRERVAERLRGLGFQVKLAGG